MLAFAQRLRSRSDCDREAITCDSLGRQPSGVPTSLAHFSPSFELGEQFFDAAPEDYPAWFSVGLAAAEA
ncbi:MAG: hypothetical protein ACTHK7_17115, partial [Aureliella sp.]